jgi:hypothetical protein
VGSLLAPVTRFVAVPARRRLPGSVGCRGSAETRFIGFRLSFLERFASTDPTAKRPSGCFERGLADLATAAKRLSTVVHGS